MSEKTIKLNSASDAGFTLAEVLIAVTVFFIVFTAVMSLMLSVINTNVSARSQTVVTNAATSYIERARSMNYHQIGTTSNAPYGSLTTTTTVTGGYTVTITPQVTWVDDPTMAGTMDYKKLVIQVSGQRAGGGVVRYSAETLIKRPDSGVNPNATPPTITFTASSPGDRDTVEGSSVNIGAVAGANGANVTLTSMNFYCDGVALQNSYGNTAQWPLNTASHTQTFSWDTEAENEDGVELSVEGWHIIKVEVWDSNGKQAFAQRLMLVDNADPFPPGSITVTPISGANQLQAAWETAVDGNTTADHYILQTLKQGPSATSTSDKTDWTGSSADYAVTSAIFSPTPLSRYCFSVRASNPTGTRISDAVEAFGVSRPLLTGTWRNTIVTDNKLEKNRIYSSTHALEWSEPSFPNSYINNTLYRSTSSSMASPQVIYDGPNLANTSTTPTSKGGATQYYHQVKTVITPSGYNGLDSGGNPIPHSSITVWSNVVGPNALSGAVSGTQAHVRW